MFRRLIESALILLVSVTAAVGAITDVRLNEFVASNANGITDEDGAHSDWIELYNTGASSVALGGAYLTDNASQLTKWQIPAVTLDPGAFLVIFASSKNRTTPGSELHTNFALSAGGEFLGLIQPDGSTVVHSYAPTYPAQTADVSYGLASDLSTQRCFLDPTPGAANDESSTCGSVAPVIFSEPHGFYDAPFDVELSTATAGAEIRYTTNGSLPTATHGTVYAAPINVAGTTILRVRAFKPGMQATDAVSSTMIFVDDVVTQTGAGFPPTWATRAADYAMDQTIVNDPVYGAEIRDDLKAIPTISVVADVEDLFGNNGIYSHPLARGDEWERPTSAELIDPAGGAGFHTNCSIQIHGNSSRLTGNPKHSMRLTFNPDFGPATLNYPLFPGASVTQHRSLVLRTGWQDGWIKFGARALFIRDQYTSDTQIALGQEAARGIFVHLYLNGLYWGLYDLHERPTDWYGALHFGGDNDDWDVIKDNALDDGERDAWDTLAGLINSSASTPAGYAAVQEYLDVDNLIDYIMANHYTGNKEWTTYNWIMMRRRVPGETFKFFSWDSERTLGTVRYNATRGGRASSRPTGMYGNLRQYSAEFRQRFKDRVQTHYFGAGALTPAVAEARFLARANEIYGPLVAESARWGDARGRSVMTRDEHWVKERDRLLTDFFPDRSQIVLDQYRRIGLAD